MYKLMASAGLTVSFPRSQDIHVYYFCDALSGLVIYFMLVFSPWAFGTTQPGTIWTMNVCGYGLGLLLLVKVGIRSVRKYEPGSCNDFAAAKAATVGVVKRSCGNVCLGPIENTCSGPDFLARALGVCTAAILGYCLVAALNAHATYDAESMTFEYRDYLRWLPSTLDSRSTWQMFWNYLSLACWFWAVRHWLPGTSLYERATDSLSLRSRTGSQRVSPLPVRLKKLLWVLTISGGLLGLQGIAQRLAGSPKLLFILTPEIHQEAQEQFASYAYRANAGQYFNLLWPVCLGFWWIIFRSTGGKGLTSYLLLGSAAIMAACPIISGARGAAVADLALLVFLTPILLLSPKFHSSNTQAADPTNSGRRQMGKALLSRRFEASADGEVNRSRPNRIVILFFIGTLALGLSLGWKQLRPRMNNLAFGLAEREELYERARQIASDYPLFGIGPGAFEKVFQLYRRSGNGYWPSQLHNDWLETRVTFGWLGTGLMGVALLLILGHSTTGFRAPTICGLDLFLWLALLGCLVQARWDFPFQVYSILLLVVLWCSLLCTLHPKPARLSFTNQ
jgi:hypothetical protein